MFFSLLSTKKQRAIAIAVIGLFVLLHHAKSTDVHTYVVNRERTTLMIPTEYALSSQEWKESFLPNIERGDRVAVIFDLYCLPVPAVRIESLARGDLPRYVVFKNGTKNIDPRFISHNELGRILGKNYLRKKYQDEYFLFERVSPDG